MPSCSTSVEKIATNTSIDHLVDVNLNVRQIPKHAIQQMLISV